MNHEATGVLARPSRRRVWEKRELMTTLFRPLSLAIAASVLFVWAESLAVPSYRQRLPSHLQCGTCHVNAAGGGPRNAFGDAFLGAGRVWNAVLCQQDSDGDTFSNGTELGDPTCEWSVNQPARQRLSHPGDPNDRPEEAEPPPPDVGDDGDEEPVQYGLRGAYFANGFDLMGSDCGGPGPAEDFVRIDPNVDFRWADGSPVPGWCVNGFSVRWTAWLTVPETGTYFFYMWGNDFADLYIDGQLVVHSRNNGWGGDGIHLTADEPVPFRIDYFEGAASAVIFLLWVPPWEPEMPDLGWVMGQDIQAMFGERFVSRGHRLGLLVPPESFTPREPIVDQEPVVQVLPIDPLISEGRVARAWGARYGLDGASFAVYSDIPVPRDTAVRIQIEGSAEEDVDYVIRARLAWGIPGPRAFSIEEGLILPAQHGLSQLYLSQLDNERVDGPRTIEVTVLPGDGYRVGPENRTVIRILDDEVPDGVPGVALGGFVRGLGADEWAVVWVQRPNGGVLASDIAFEDDVFILDNLPEDDLELHGAVDLNLNGVADPGEPRFAPEGIPITVPPTRLDLVVDFERGVLVDRELEEGAPDGEPAPGVDPDPENESGPGDAPAQEAPVGPEDQEPAEANPPEDPPAGELPAEEQPPEAQPPEDPPAEEQPAEEQSPEEQPSEEQPPEEQPPEEQLPEEQPPEEQPPEDQPPEDQPPEAQPPEAQPAAEGPSEHGRPDGPDESHESGPQARRDQQQQQREGRLEAPPRSAETAGSAPANTEGGGCVAADGSLASGWLLLLTLGWLRRRRL